LFGIESFEDVPMNWKGQWRNQYGSVVNITDDSNRRRCPRQKAKAGLVALYHHERGYLRAGVTSAA
jgi:hypothetical protein